MLQPCGGMLMAVQVVEQRLGWEIDDVGCDWIFCGYCKRGIIRIIESKS